MKKKKKSNFLFNFISPVYGLFYNGQKKRYKEIIDKIRDEINISKYKNILDVGCGTGALCSVLDKEGLEVTGIDPAINMLNIGARKPENINIEFIKASTDLKLPFDDKSFDISIASYVAHGLIESERLKMFKEMSRVTKHLVIFHDYNTKRAFKTNVIEALEGGNYFKFIKNIQIELKEHFSSFKVINVDKQVAWYICKPF